MNSILIQITIQLAYSHSERLLLDTRLQCLVNLFFFDGLLCIASPLILLYGSGELRRSLKEKAAAAHGCWKRKAGDG